MPRTATDRDHRAGRAQDELARIMAHTTEACLQEQITELQVDLAEARLAQARPCSAAAAKEQRDRANQRVTALEARMARQCRLVATQAAAGRNTAPAEALLQDLERLLALAHTCRRRL